jgi:hypothetical protein
MFCGKRPVGFESIVREIYASDNWYLQYIDCDGMDGEDFHYKLDFHDSIYIKDDGALYKSIYNRAFFFDNLRYYPRGNDRYYDAGKIIRTWTRSFFTTRPRRTNYVPGEDYRNEEIEIVDERSTAIPILRFVNRVVAYTDDIKPFPAYFKKQFEVILLDSETDEGGQQEDTFDVSVEPKPKQQQQEVKSVETTLSYNKATGKFRFGTTESIAISITNRHKIRNVAETLIEWWMKGEPCPKNELGTPSRSHLPQSVLDNISAIRQTLFNDLEVNMPQSTDEGYLPPKEPKHFKIIG